MLIEVIRSLGAEPIFVVQASTDGTKIRKSHTGAGVACALLARVNDVHSGVCALSGAKKRPIRQRSSSRPCDRGFPG